MMEMLPQTKGLPLGHKPLTGYDVDDCSTDCPSEDPSYLGLDDPENVRLLNECLPDENTFAGNLKSVLNCSEAVLDRVRAQKEAEEKIFDAYAGDAVAGLREKFAGLGEQVAVFTEEVMQTSTKVQTVIVDLRMGLKFLRKLKIESSKGASADQSKLSSLSKKTVEYLDKGRLTAEVTQELETLTTSSKDLMTQASSAHEELEAFNLLKKQEVEQLQDEQNRKFKLFNDSWDLKLQKWNSQVEQAKEEMDAIQQTRQAHQQHLRELDEQYQQSVDRVAQQREALLSLKQNAKRTSQIGVALSSAALIGLVAATLLSGGTATVGVLAWVSWTSGHLYTIAGVSAAVNGAYLGFQDVNIRASMQAENEAMEDAIRIKRDHEESLEELEKNLLRAQVWTQEKFEEAERQKQAMLKAQALELERVMSEMRAMQAPIQELQRKFQAAQDLANHYKAFVEELAKMKLPEHLKSMVKSLKDLGVIQREVSECENLADDDVELVQELASEALTQNIDSTIDQLNELDRMNTALSRKAQKIFNSYYGLSEDVNAEIGVAEAADEQADLMG